MIFGLHIWNMVFLLVLLAFGAATLLYMLVGLANKYIFAEPEAPEEHRYAAVISARNEEGVIGGLIRSLRAQRYPADKLDIYVVADNCTDRTAEVAERAGATVYVRRNAREVGKGYALDFLFQKLLTLHAGRHYAGYFIFDADNVVDENFTAEMNKTFCRGGYDAITCYRSSKNFGDNWISAGYSIWFLRQSRFLNFPRSLLGLNCAVGGTGFFVSDRLIRENGGWPFHLLTEDIEFSADCAVRGRAIGYCDRAVVFDEQPTAFRQSWDQRLRWSKGFYQVDRDYTVPLLKGCFRPGRLGTSCYDMFVTVAPGMLLTLVMILFNGIILATCMTQPAYIAARVMDVTLGFMGSALWNFYVGLFVYGLLTVLSEWKHINASPLCKLGYVITFPIFMFTYIPISIAALVKKVEWKPIYHSATKRVGVS